MLKLQQLARGSQRICLNLLTPGLKVTRFQFHLKKMEFSREKRLKARLAGDRRGDLYPHSLQFYLQPPTENISLAEFENFAIDRLKLLKVVENLGVSYVKGSDEYKSRLEREIRKLKFPFRALVEDDYDARRKDHISHFILRLAYCQSEDLRRWFIQQEMDLFRYRFNELNGDLVEKFLKYVNLSYGAISKEVKEKLAVQLLNSTPGLSGAKVEELEFYKVPLQDAMDLFRVRRVYLLNAFAYVPQTDIVAIVLNNFRTKLSKALALTARSLPAVQSDERLQPLLNHLSHSYVGPDYSIQKNIGKISLEHIDALSVKSFPLCMRQLHKALRDNHHLRHGGRMQYGLFLKGIGLTLEQALQFWKSEFIKGKVDADKILELVKGMHYQLACQKYFQLTQDVDDIGFSLNHPNQYFAESQKLLSGGREVKKEPSEPESSQQKLSSQKSTNSCSIPISSNTEADTELEGLDAYFTED
ncbi:DNA primase large subunit isoform X5 [Chrysemys picta bellii]|uniref:DNA primase large subunit isoform X5 n=2 Tax=Chrysemys picta bellii TaxID=8478 RepID=UPI0032B276D0